MTALDSSAVPLASSAAARGLRARLADALPRAAFGLYAALFFTYLLLPLAILAAATFNASSFPTISPWLGTTLKWVEAARIASGRRR